MCSTCARLLLRILSRLRYILLRNIVSGAEHRPRSMLRNRNAFSLC